MPVRVWKETKLELFQSFSDLRNSISVGYSSLFKEAQGAKYLFSKIGRIMFLIMDLHNSGLVLQGACKKEEG